MNKELFSNDSQKVGVNSAGGQTYFLTEKTALAQFTCTGTFNGTFYDSAEKQLSEFLNLASKVDSEFIAKLAVYSRQKSYMKDMPASLCAILAGRKDPESNRLLKLVFDKVIDSGKMVRNFVQLLRSGKFGRKSLGRSPKNLVNSWINSRSPEQLFRDAIGNDPSLVDVLRMMHPNPKTKEHEALFGYLLGRKYVFEQLPKVVQEFELWKKNPTADIPNVDFRYLTSVELPKEAWEKIAETSSWTTARMNLNTFARHGLLLDEGIVKNLAKKISNKELVKKSKVFPYQLLAAFKNVDSSVPMKLSLALQDAMEHAVENVPDFGDKKVVVCVDVSGSMRSPVTGTQKVSSKVNCVDVAGLIASVILRKNPNTKVITFDTSATFEDLNPRDSIMTNAKKLAKNGGGTDCSRAISLLNSKKEQADLVFMISDNESWESVSDYKGTRFQAEWEVFVKNNKDVKLVNLDIVPSAEVQNKNSARCLNIGGFSDNIFEIVADFVKEQPTTKDFWAKKIQEIKL